MVCIRLPAELYDYIEKQATEKKMLVSEVARNIIRDAYVGTEKQAKTRVKKKRWRRNRRKKQ